mgnify:FL=1
MKHKNLYIGIAVIIGVLLLGDVIINYAFALPDVHFSYSQEHCVKVVNYTDTNFSCENMPDKFYHVWVK